MLHHMKGSVENMLLVPGVLTSGRKGREGLEMTDLSRVGRNCVNGKHTIEILEGQERRGC